MRKQQTRKIEFKYYKMPIGKYLYLTSIPKWISESEYNKKILHFHNFMEIGYCISGHGKIYFGEEVSDYKPGDFTIIPAKYPHKTVADKDSFSHWAYIFIDDKEFLKNTYDNKYSKKIQKIEENINKKSYILESAKSPILVEDIKNLIDIMTEQDEFFEEEAHAMLISIFIKIARKEGRADSFIEDNFTNVRSVEIMKRAMEYIDIHYQEDVKIGDIAKYCYVSETHLRRIFTNNIKMGVLDYLNYIRIEKACYMLDKTNSSIATIASSCGLPILSTFNRNFKQNTGLSPNIYRKRNK